MACGVTLKRSLELDSLMSPEASLKRRRTSMNAGHCAPFRPSFSNSPPHHPPNAEVQQQATSTSTASAAMPSSFVSAGPKISPEELESYLMSEIHLLRRRRLLSNRQSEVDACFGGRLSPSSNSDSDSEHHMDSSAPMTIAAHGGFLQNASIFRSPQQTQIGSSSPIAHSERPLFTFKQVRMICERLMKEQEVRLREEYEQVLSARLAEQYETFVRFTYDQIHRRIDDSPMTYLS